MKRNQNLYQTKGANLIQFQQGDVILKTTKVPTGDFEMVEDPILQHGEATGHAHRLQFRHDSIRTSGTCKQWEILKDKHSPTRYLKVLEPTDLTHEEHKKITIPPGEYEIAIVQEYDHFLEEARQVID